jgi:transglutaminase-like putative cysteine protease
MIKTRKFFAFLLGSVFSVGFVYAQPKNELFLLQQKHPDQSVVFTHVDETVNINLVNGKLNINMIVDKESMLLDDRAALYSESRVSYSSLIYLSSLSASTLYPENKKYKEIKVSEFKESDKLGGSIFYDDVKEKKFNYPSLVKGAKRKISMNYEIKDPYLLSSFLLPEYFPVEKTALKIVCPSDVEIGYKIFNADSVDIQYSVTKLGNKTIHEWKSSDIKKMESESDGPGHLYYTPHIVYFIKSYTANGKKEKILESLDDLHSYYSKLVKPINQTDYEPLKKISDSLTANLKTDELKIKSIFYWVKDNIKYIAFESGYEGFIPRESKDVFEKRYGDCKDMASILTSMMKYAGIKSYLTWIGSRELPYKYSENPTMGADNHMIASVKLNGQYLFLDATSRNTPFGYPTAFIQGKEAIVHLSDDKYEVVQVPEVAPTKSINRDSVFIELTKDLKLSGSGLAEYTGYERNHMMALLQDETNEKKTNTLKNYYRKGNNKFILEFYEEFNTTDRDKPYNISYKFNVSDYVLKSGDELFVNMNLDKLYDKGSIEKTRKVDLEFDYKRVFSNVVTIKIPENYEVGYLPNNDSFQDELFGYSIKYSVDKNTITLKSDITINCLLLQKKQFNLWNDFVAKLKKNYTESVAFKKKTN